MSDTSSDLWLSSNNDFQAIKSPQSLTSFCNSLWILGVYVQYSVHIPHNLSYANTFHVDVCLSDFLSHDYTYIDLLFVFSKIFLLL